MGEMEPEVPNEQAACNAVECELACTPITMERMTFGHNSITYSADFADRAPIIIRTNRNPAVFAKTRSNLTHLAQLGLPVPCVLAADLSCSRFPFAYLILEKIPGRDLRYELPTMTPAQMTGTAGQIVGFQKAVGAGLPQGDGFGYVSIGETGPFPTWKALLHDETEYRVLFDGPFASYKTRFAEAFRRCDRYLDNVMPTCFLDDLTTKNVIVEQGQLRGVIDFDTVCYGDPLFMVGLTAATVVCDVGLNALVYVDEVRRLWNLSAAQNQAADLYSALMTLRFLHQFHLNETPEWKARMTFALENRWMVDS